MTVLPCPGCGAATATALLAYGATLQPAVVSLARNALPAWQPQDGLCPRCALRFTQQLAARRSPLSLHTTTEPNTTFPFYDWDEETVLSQPARLPGYETITAAGVTIAFLDSGYYPHPDFSTAAQWPGAMPAWQQLDQRSLRALFAQANLRLIQYADLTDEGEQVGLETPSLWDDAGDSWHGQMTMAVAAGNGLLSGGVYRGYATGASLLPVKVGRSGGRIPEADILRGLTWLLADDNWQRYGVRVVNISVGGDFPQDWQHNPVCRAAHALAQRGVFVAAAAGNRGAEELLAPAQTPTVMTVGGVDDQNRRWRPTRAAEVEALTLYNHNFGAVTWRHALVRKPEILALARWLPSPILPPSRVFKETYAIERVRRALHAIEAELEAPAVRPSPLAAGGADPRPSLTRSLARSAPADECTQVAAALLPTCGRDQRGRGASFGCRRTDAGGEPGPHGGRCAAAVDGERAGAAPSVAPPDRGWPLAADAGGGCCFAGAGRATGRLSAERRRFARQ